METKDKKTELVPNESVGVFKLGNNIKEYLNLNPKYYPKIDEYTDDMYDFCCPELSIWTNDDGVINSISCHKECYWQGNNLIKMLFEEFLSKYKINPDQSENIYLMVNERGQNQMVYDFNDLGLQIWVWRKKIVTVIVSSYKGLDD